MYNKINKMGTISGTLFEKSERKSSNNKIFWHLKVRKEEKEFKFFHWFDKCEFLIGQEVSVAYITKQMPGGGFINETQKITPVGGDKSKEVRITAGKEIQLKEGVQKRMEEKVATLTKFVNADDIDELTSRMDKEAVILGRCFDRVANVINKKPQTDGELRLVELVYKSVKK